VDRKEILNTIIVLQQLRRQNEDLMEIIERNLEMDKLAINQLKLILNDPLYYKDN